MSFHDGPSGPRDAMTPREHELHELDNLIEDLLYRRHRDAMADAHYLKALNDAIAALREQRAVMEGRTP